MFVTLLFNTVESEGFLFNENWLPGIVYYTLVPPLYTTHDNIAFGFMTDVANGTILRPQSGISDYIEAKLVSFCSLLLKPFIFR